MQWEKKQGKVADLILVGVGVLASRRLLGAVLFGRRAEGPLDGGEPRRPALLIPHRDHHRRATAVPRPRASTTHVPSLATTTT